MPSPCPCSPLAAEAAAVPPAREAALSAALPAWEIVPAPPEAAPTSLRAAPPSLPEESGSASTPEGGGTSSGSASQGGSSSGTAEGGNSQTAQLTLNRSDFTLFSAGSTFQLKYQAPAGAQGEASFASSDEAVATVGSGRAPVTAVAPGSATITLTYGDLTASCTVRCRWEDAPADTGDSSTRRDGGQLSGRHRNPQ